ncbi:MAG: DNA mismatch repair protein MutS, partial [Myxococcota bacterium]
MTEPEKTYRDALSARRSELEQLERGDVALANWRTAVFAVAVLLAIGSWGFAAWSAGWLGAPAFAFLVLVVRHDRLAREMKRTQRAIDYYARGLRRLSSEWHGEGIVENDIAPEEHPYAVDLDVFGIGSLFDLIATTRTPAGTQRLAEWLLVAGSREAILERQEAIAELRERTALREDLALLA